MSTPTSAMITRATVSLTPGIVVSRSAASREGAQDLVGLLLQLLHGRPQCIDLPQVQLQQETVVLRHPPVYRGDDVRTVGLLSD